jgi:hypothetical protein
MMPKQLEQYTKNVDSTGRINLGKSFANQTVLIQYKENGEILIRLAQTPPHSETWLSENEQALSLIQQGLEEAQNSEFSLDPPNLQESFSFAKLIPDEE